MRFRGRTLAAATGVCLALGGGIAALPAEGADRPFPDYTLSYEWIHGKVDPNWKPGDAGDGCLRSDDFTVTHLSTFAFGATIEPCDGVRTTMTFAYSDPKPDPTKYEPTLEFRWGTTWQYKKRNENGPWIWKPVENLRVNGQPVSTELYDYKTQEGTVVKKSDGTWRHVGDDKRSYFEPKHIVFDATMEFDEQYTFTWDAYLPADADYGGISIGTGSTGDTQGGVIGAKANGLDVVIPAAVDYRYVLDSEYRAALGIEELDESGKPVKIPNRPLAFWGGPIKGSTYTTVSCLEEDGQHLAPVLSKQATTSIYPDLKKYPSITGSEVTFRDEAGSYALARYPYEFYIGQPGNWASLAGMRLMNYDDATGKFSDFGDKDVPYKPTFESVRRDIPGYHYVDNDLPQLAKGKLDMPGYKHVKAPNLKLSYHKYSRATAPAGTDASFDGETQHLYFTYAPNPGTFEVSKTNQQGEALAGAKFELYKLVDDKPSACGVQPDMTNVEEHDVCDVRTPANDAELRDMLATKPAGCATKKMRKITLNGFDPEGTFTTDADGRFTPAGDPALLPGQYLLREVSAPEPHKILNEFVPFELQVQAGKDDAGKTVSKEVPAHVDVVNYTEPPEPTPTPTPTPTPEPTPTQTPTPTPEPTPTSPATPVKPKPGLPRTGIGSESMGLPALMAVVVIGTVAVFNTRKND